MKKSIFLIAASIVILNACRNQEQNLNADIEIPVLAENIKLKSIEEFINTTGICLPKRRDRNQIKDYSLILS